MEYNIINEYVMFIKRELHSFFKIIFGDKYQKKMCEPFIDRYITVRYYNETNYTRDRDIMNRLNKELVDVYEDNVNDDNEDMLKNIVALFAYIVYFDDVYPVNSEGEVIDTLVTDEDIRIERGTNFKKDIRKWYLSFKKSKEKFNSTIMNREFHLEEDRLYRKTFSLKLGHDVKISNLYSEYAINKAYNSGIINEDKMFITYILSSFVVLNNAINLDFSRHYVVDMANSLFSKDKKMNRLFSVIDNILAKKFIFIKITFSDYIHNKDKINKLINDGYSFGIVIDNSFDGNIRELVLFPYIFIYEDNEYSEEILNEKENIKSKIIQL